MTNCEITRTIKYQEELDPGFCAEISSIPGGHSLSTCIQCGTCSSTCPVSAYMEFTPRRIIAMTRAGFKNEVLRSNTIWLCASCYACTVDCPREIKITDVMYALKQKALREGVYPARFPVAVLAKEFFKMVLRTGRSNEGLIVTLMFLKTNPLKLFNQIGIGLKLLMRGRMAMKVEGMSGDRSQLTKLMAEVEKQQKTTAN